MLNEQTIREMAKVCGIDALGFHDGRPHEEWLDILIRRREVGCVTDFENVSPEERIDYRLAFPEVKTVIVVALPVAPGAEMPEDMSRRGRMAAVAWGEDYHLRVKRALTDLGEAIKTQIQDARYQVYVDNSRLLDRASAWRAGLGFFGKNNLLIHPRYGSFFFIGQLLIDQFVDYEIKAPLDSQCGSCTRCLEACPGGALGQGYTLNPSRCGSYLTQKKELTSDEADLIREYLYGCDLCQLSCPFNREVLARLDRCGEADLIYPRLDQLLEMSGGAFKRIFGKTAAGWRGRKILARNAAIIKNRRKTCDKL